MYWYDINRTLTFNALYNMIIGSRGCGKTFGAKEWAAKDFIKSEGQFAFIRRYDSELNSLVVKKFWSDLEKENLFPEHELKVDGRVFTIDDKQAGYAVPLSTARIEKGIPFPNVNKIIFDEFLIDNQSFHYLKDEVLAFLDLYETIARLRPVRVFFLSNAITRINPYFMFWDLELPRAKNNIIKKGDVLVELVQNQEYIEMKKQTRFGKLVEGTKYAEYAIDNKFLRDTPDFIEKKSDRCSYLFTFRFKGDLFGVWYDYSRGRLWVSDNVDPSHRTIYSMTLEDHTPNTMLLKRYNQDNYFKLFVESYKQGNVWFESQRIKNITYELIKLILT